MAVNVSELHDGWPDGPEATLLFKYLAHFYHQSIVDSLKVPLKGEEDIQPTPELHRRIEQLVRKGQRKEAWKRRKVAIRKVAKVAAAAAIVTLFITALPTVLFAISPEFRETVYKYIIDWRQGHVDINISEELPVEHTLLMLAKNVHKQPR